jgi:predicted DNA-binding helix-hairpin-helix protein
VPFDRDGNLDLEKDPKQKWAEIHSEMFPVNVNKSSRLDLLRVPGLGPVTVDRIMNIRKSGTRIRALDDLGAAGKRMHKAKKYVTY